jgi:transcriptional regulator with XRE-family HTH domain
VTKEQKADLERQLREALGKTGLSLNEIGRRSGVSQPVLSRFMRGERTLTLPVASKLCQMLGLRLCEDEGAGQAEVPPAKKGRKRKRE